MKSNAHTKQRKKSSFYINANKQPFNFKLFSKASIGRDIVESIQTYSAYTQQQLKTILDSFIEKKKFKALICSVLKLDYLFDSIVVILQEEYTNYGLKYKIQDVIDVLVNGKFYRKLPKQNEFRLVQNNKSTQVNVKCAIAATFAFASSKFTLHQIQHILKIFQFQQRLNDSHPQGISLDILKLTRILKKLNRSIKPLQFKQWIQDFKILSNAETIDNYQFLYLINLTQNKFSKQSHVFLGAKFVKQQITIKEIAELEKQNKQEQITTILLNKQDQKYRIKSFSYKNSRQSLPAILNFEEIKKQIKRSSQKILQKKKSLSLFGRIKMCTEDFNCQDVFRQKKIITSKSTQKHSSNKKKSQRSEQKSRKQNLLKAIAEKKERKPLILGQRKNQNNQNRRIELNKEQYRLSQNFMQIYNYEQGKIQRMFQNIQSNKIQ